MGSPDRPLPRAPAIYNRKTRWALKDDGSMLHGDWSANYSSLAEHAAQVEKQYDEEVAEDLMEKV